MTTGHLSEEQFADWLAGERQAAAVAHHLEGCAQCRGEIASTEASVLAFNDMGRAWSEAAAPHLVRSPSRLEVQLGGRPAWGMAVAAMVTACLMAVGLEVRNTHLQSAATAAEASASPSDAELAEDNEMMQSIDQELKYRVVPAIPAAMLRVGAQRREGHFASAIAN